MLKNENNDDLISRNVNEEYIYFIQLWRELTDSRTLDSYQAKLLYIISAFKELIEVIKNTLNSSYSTDHNIEACKDELSDLVSGDLILKKHYPDLQKIIIKQLHISSKQTNEKYALLHQIESFLIKLEPDYCNKVFIELEQSISSKNLAEIKFYTNTIVSSLIDKGWSLKALHNLIKLLYNSSIDSSKWTQFKNLCTSANVDKYKIYIPLKIQYPPSNKEIIIQNLKILNSDIEIKEGNDIITELQEENVIRNKFKIDQSYVILTEESYDYYAATAKAVNEYAILLNSLSFYHLISPWTLSGITFITLQVNNSVGKIIEVSNLYGMNDYFGGLSYYFNLSKNIVCNKNNPLRTKFLATYSYANIGKATYSQEERFINIWISLESLCKSDMYSTIIENLSENVPPALCRRYIFSLYKNFYEDIKRCNVDITTFASKSFVIDSNTKIRNVVKYITEILTTESLYNELLEKCKVNSLLLSRCAEIYSLATDYKVIIQKLQKHYKNVTNQIIRLYRIRNKIAHTAMSSNTSLVLYTEHLSNYLFTFIGEVLSYSKHSNSIPQIFSMIKDNYDAFSEIVSCKDNNEAYKKEKLMHLMKTGELSII